MKRYIFILIGVFLPFFTFAQNDKGHMSNVLIKIFDGSNKEVLAFATITVYNLAKDSSAVNIGVANKNGDISFKLLPGRYVAKASMIGYKGTNGAAFEINELAPVLPLTLTLERSLNALKEVNITGSKKTIEAISGGYKFNVDRVVGATGNIFEVLRQVPGITVDGSNAIKLQGRGPTVMINGRKVNMSGNDLVIFLKSLSATQVSAINVNTNPNAKYDAAGEGGILDIRLKQHTVAGLFGSVSSDISSLISTDQSANVNLKKGKFDVTGSFNFVYRQDAVRRKNYYENKTLPDSLYIFKQDQISHQYQRGESVKAGIAYAIDSTSSLSFNFFDATFHSGIPWLINSVVYNRADVFQNKYVQNQNTNISNNFYIYDVIYQKSFKNQNRLNVGFNYSKYGNQSDDLFSRNFYDENNRAVNDQYTESRNFITTRPYDLTATNIDYTINLGKITKIDFGAKYTTASTESNFTNNVFDTLQNKYVFDPILSNNLTYHEHIGALYSLLSSKFRKLNYQLGLRYEDYHYELKSPALPAAYGKTYSNFFPSLNLSYNSDDHKSGYSLNYGRRIQRPGYAMLNPFLNTSTLGQYTSGNPYLKPYFINKIEFQFTRSYGDSNFFLAALFATHSANIYSQLFRYDLVNQMNVETYDNFRTSDQYGGYVVLQNNITKWFNFNAYLSATQPKFSSKIPGDVLLPGIFNVTGNLSLNFNLPDRTQFQIYGYCVTKNNNFQLQNATNENVSIAAQHRFFKNKLTVSVNFEDIFNINNFPIRGYSENVYLDSYNKLKSQYVKAGLNYTFGNSFKAKSVNKLNKDVRVE